MSKNEIAKTNNTALAGIEDFDDFAGVGFEDSNASDFVIPRIGLIGDLSPQKKEGHAKYMPEVKVGDILDVALGVKLASGYAGEVLPFLPVQRVKEVIEWKPRSAGGGIVNREVMSAGKKPDDYIKAKGAVQNDKFEWKLPNGNELIETWQLFGIDLTRYMPVFVPFKKSNIKVIKPWYTNRANTKFPSGTPNAGKSLPLMFRVVELGSFKDSGNGNEWANWVMKDGATLKEYSGDSFEDLKSMAKGLADILKSGNYVAAGEQDEDGEGDIPF